MFCVGGIEATTGAAVIFDPRAFVMGADGLTYYHPRDPQTFPLLPREMQQWLDEHPEWPPTGPRQFAGFIVVPSEQQ